MRVDNKYIKCILGVREYFETYLKDKIWDVKLFESQRVTSYLYYILPSSNISTRNYKR